jgi:hypothetical protein
VRAEWTCENSCKIENGLLGGRNEPIPPTVGLATPAPRRGFFLGAGADDGLSSAASFQCPAVVSRTGDDNGPFARHEGIACWLLTLSWLTDVMDHAAASKEHASLAKVSSYSVEREYVLSRTVNRDPERYRSQCVQSELVFLSVDIRHSRAEDAKRDFRFCHNASGCDRILLKRPHRGIRIHVRDRFAKPLE